MKPCHIKIFQKIAQLKDDIDWDKAFKQDKLITWIRQALQTKHEGIVFHSLRHGGASHYFFLVDLTKEQLQKIGRWLLPSSVSVYIHAAIEFAGGNQHRKRVPTDIKIFRTWVANIIEAFWPDKEVLHTPRPSFVKPFQQVGLTVQTKPSHLFQTLERLRLQKAKEASKPQKAPTQQKQVPNERQNAVQNAQVPVLNPCSLVLQPRNIINLNL